MRRNHRLEWIGITGWFASEYAPSEKLEAVEAALPPALRRGRFKAPDALIAALLDPQTSHRGMRALS